MAQVLKKKTNFVGSKTLNFSIKYIIQSTKLPSTMKVLYPFIERLLYEIVIPVMQVTIKDVNLFNDEPIEYVRKQNDFTETLFTAKNTMVDMLTGLCQYKTNKKAKRPDFLKKYLEFCYRSLVEFNS